MIMANINALLEKSRQQEVVPVAVTKVDIVYTSELSSGSGRSR